MKPNGPEINKNIVDNEQIFFEDKTSQFKNNLALLDAFIIIVSMLISILYYSITNEYDNNVRFLPNASILPIMLLLFSYFLYKFKGYKTPRDSSSIKYFIAVTKSVFMSFGVVLLLLYVTKIEYISLDILKLFVCLAWPFLFIDRLIFYLLYRKSVFSGKNKIEVVIIGTGKRAKTLSEKMLEKSKWGINIVGYLDVDPALVGGKINGREVLGTLANIHDILKSHVVDEVIIAIPRAMISNMDRIVSACEEEGVRIRMMADFFDVNMARIRLVEIGNIPLMTLDPVAHDEMKLLLKRILDFLVTLMSMPLILPVMAIVAVAIRVDSPGPVFFTQKRVGKNKRIFKMYKFRSMVAGSEEMMKNLEHMNEAKGPIFKIAKDPRITKVGHFIRKTSLDELPQLFNVLLGEMSLVGPRPMSLRDVDLFDKGIQRKRFSMKPGLTCLWQISGRSNLPFEKWLELDLKYIETWSLLDDFNILLKTIPVVIKGSGAV